MSHKNVCSFAVEVDWFKNTFYFNPVHACRWLRSYPVSSSEQEYLFLDVWKALACLGSTANTFITPKVLLALRKEVNQYFLDMAEGNQSINPSLFFC